MSDYEYPDYNFEYNEDYVSDYGDDDDYVSEQDEDITYEEGPEFSRYEQEFSQVLNPSDFGRIGGVSFDKNIITPKERALNEFTDNYLTLSGTDSVSKNTISNIEKLNILTLNMNILSHVAYAHDSKTINPKNYKPADGTKINNYDFYRYYKLYTSILQ